MLVLQQKGLVKRARLLAEPVSLHKYCLLSLFLWLTVMPKLDALGDPAAFGTVVIQCVDEMRSEHS